MPRDDDDEDRPRKKGSRDEDDGSFEDDRPRKKSSRDDEDGDADRPRKKGARDEDDDRGGKTIKSMPGGLIGAIIVSMAWGILTLHSSCVHSSNSILVLKQLRDMQLDLRGLGGGQGSLYTILGTQIFMVLMSALLLAGGIALVMRMGFGKFLAMGAPAAMVLVEIVGFVICLIITKGVFLAPHNIDFTVNIVLSLAVGGCNIFLLLNKDVSRALR